MARWQLFAGMWPELRRVVWDVHMCVCEAPCSLEGSQRWHEKKGQAAGRWGSTGLPSPPAPPAAIDVKSENAKSELSLVGCYESVYVKTGE